VSLLFWGRACLAGKKLSFCAPAGTNESGKGNNMSKLREVDGKRNVISQQNRARRSRDACDAWCGGGGGTAPGLDSYTSQQIVRRRLAFHSQKPFFCELCRILETSCAKRSSNYVLQTLIRITTSDK